MFSHISFVSVLSLLLTNTTVFSLHLEDSTDRPRSTHVMLLLKQHHRHPQPIEMHLYDGNWKLAEHHLTGSNCGQTVTWTED